MDTFDKEAFIDEVEKRPVIWDTDNPEYYDRILKKKAWEELTEIFADPSYSKEKKSIFHLQLQKKWKNLRDTYIKEYKKIKSNPSKTSYYIYYARLSFLQKCLKNKLATTFNDYKDTDVDITTTKELLSSMNDRLSKLKESAREFSSNSSKSSEMNQGLSSPPLDAWEKVDLWKTDSIGHVFPSLSRYVLEKDTYDEKIRTVISTHKGSSSKQNKDPDKLFCLSLYKEIRKVPEHNRLNVKIELLHLIRTAQMLPLNEIQMPDQDEKPQGLPHLVASTFKKLIPTKKLDMESKVISHEEVLSRVKPLKLYFDQLIEEIELSWREDAKRRGKNVIDISKYISSRSSESTLSSGSSTYNDATMETD